MCGRYSSVTLSFMPVGHTKFSPDWCFGLLKQKLRRCRVDCLDDLVDVVESSADVNNAQLTGTQSGEILVPMYDWALHLNPHFTTLPHIKWYHHFCFTQDSPGTVKVVTVQKHHSPYYSVLTWLHRLMICHMWYLLLASLKNDKSICTKSYENFVARKFVTLYILSQLHSQCQLYHSLLNQHAFQHQFQPHHPVLWIKSNECALSVANKGTIEEHVTNDHTHSLTQAHSLTHSLTLISYLCTDSLTHWLSHSLVHS